MKKWTGIAALFFSIVALAAAGPSLLLAGKPAKRPASATDL